MLSIKGVYENGQVHLLEPLPFLKRAKVIVTIVEETELGEDENREPDITLFDDLVGAVNVRSDGSIRHDHYITGETE